MYDVIIRGGDVIDGSGHDLFRPDGLAYPRAVAGFITRRALGT